MINFLKKKSSWGFEYCEDSMTSFVFEYLAMFVPADLWNIIKEACNMHADLNPGDLMDVDFWPHWHEGKFNVRYVEPDVFMKFEHLNVIIEVKRNDRVLQYPGQWINEIESFRKTYVNNPEPLIVVAVNGNLSYNMEKFDGICVYKTSWPRICDATLKRIGTIHNYQREWLKAMFEVIGVKPFCAISTLLNNSEITIDNDAINSIEKIFMINKG